MAYGDFKDLLRRTASDNVWRKKAFAVPSNLQYNGNKRGLASTV